MFRFLDFFLFFILWIEEEILLKENRDYNQRSHHDSKISVGQWDQEVDWPMKTHPNVSPRRETISTSKPLKYCCWYFGASHGSILEQDF